METPFKKNNNKKISICSKYGAASWLVQFMVSIAQVMTPPRGIDESST